jgi:tRNA pseudouridine55 synthase
VSPADARPVTDGIAVVDKEAGWTSHDVVAKARKHLGQKKVGHAGTLDPDATGVLVLGLGSATRLLRFLSDLDKGYEGEVVLGTETSTLDSSGEVTATHEMGPVTLEQARAAAATLTGDILQVPPMVSALKVDGKRLHALAREGIEVEREARPVTVSRFDVHEGSEPGVLRVEVDCSSGTYVRTLAADLGTALGGGAHLRGLRRTRVGRFTLDDAHPLEQLEVLPPGAAVAHLPSVAADEELATAVGFGKVLPAERFAADGDDGPWTVVDEEGRLLAIYQRHKGDRAKPVLVIPVT